MIKKENAKNKIKVIMEAQNNGLNNNNDKFSDALKQINNGKKTHHWIWYCLPQIQLGFSKNSIKYAITPYEACFALLNQDFSKNYLAMIDAIKKQLNTKNLNQLMGSDIDANKTISSITLFFHAASEIKTRINDQTIIKIHEISNAILTLLNNRCHDTISEWENWKNDKERDINSIITENVQQSIHAHHVQQSTDADHVQQSIHKTSNLNKRKEIYKTLSPFGPHVFYISLDNLQKPDNFSLLCCYIIKDMVRLEQKSNIIPYKRNYEKWHSKCDQFLKKFAKDPQNFKELYENIHNKQIPLKIRNTINSLEVIIRKTYQGYKYSSNIISSQIKKILFWLSDKIFGTKLLQDKLRFNIIKAAYILIEHCFNAQENNIQYSDGYVKFVNKVSKNSKEIRKIVNKIDF